jgi:hypothetical protein
MTQGISPSAVAAVREIVTLREVVVLQALAVQR